MEKNTVVEYDYTYYENRGPEVYKMVCEYFKDSYELIEKSDLLPFRPENNNRVGIGFDFMIYDNFEVRFLTREESFVCIILYYINPEGYKLREGAEWPVIASYNICNDVEGHKELIRNPTDENIMSIIGELDNFLKLVIKEKENADDKSYFEIVYKKMCEFQGEDFDKEFNLKFEKIKEKKPLFKKLFGKS